MNLEERERERENIRSLSNFPLFCHIHCILIVMWAKLAYNEVPGVSILTQTSACSLWLGNENNLLCVAKNVGCLWFLVCWVVVSLSNYRQGDSDDLKSHSFLFENYAERRWCFPFLSFYFPKKKKKRSLKCFSNSGWTSTGGSPKERCEIMGGCFLILACYCFMDQYQVEFLLYCQCCML